ncbi:MAG: GIY-YIG nuclease family protein [Armatimonadetes bacterium]|nr:GIY-YIG nuclease family protein [Armatimonadota bacterium]
MSSDKRGYVYIMTNVRHTVLYTGVTSDLIRRVYQHREGLCPGFTRRYNVVKLVYFEDHDRMDDAIAREKAIKGGSRDRKLTLIESMNPGWRDLYDDVAPGGNSAEE